MNTVKKVVFFVLLLALLLASCQPLEPIISTPTSQPLVESWEGLEEGWMIFSEVSDEVKQEEITDVERAIIAVRKQRQDLILDSPATARPHRMATARRLRCYIPPHTDKALESA